MGGALHHGAVSRSRLPFHQYGRGVGGGGRDFSFLGQGRNSAARAKNWTVRRPGAGRSPLPAPSRLQGWREGFGPPRPSLFCSALHPPGPRQPPALPVGWGVGGRQARGERDPKLQPRLAMRGSPHHHHCPQRLGGGGCNAEISPAPPAATQEASGAAPAIPPRIPTLAATTPTPQRAAGRRWG